MNHYPYVCLAVCLLCFANNTVEACPDIRSHDFYNSTYDLRSEALLKAEPYEFRARLTNGMFEEPHDNADLNSMYARIRSVRFGDLTNDGIDDAAVAVEYGSGSASFFLTNYFVLTCRQGAIRTIGSIQQDQLQKQTLEMVHESTAEPIYISKGILFIRHGVGGSRPSPSFVASFRYRVASKRLQKFGRPSFKKILNDDQHNSSKDHR